MELMTKQGYKQTEVGLIPEDWKVKALGDVGDVQMCKRIFSYQTSKRGEVPFYKIGTFGKEPNAFISWDLYQEFRKKYSFPKKGYLLISASGTIGRTVEYLGEDAYYQDSNIIWIDNDEKLISNKYLYYTLKVIKYKTEGSTIKRLYNSIIKSSKFVIPPTLTEQKAIATALSDVDALIACLEQTITKKKAIKQGAMQVLFKELYRWDRKRVSEFGFDISDGNYSAKYPKASEFKASGVPFIRANNLKNMTVNDKDMRFISEELHSELKKGHLKKDDILITNRGDIGQTALVPDKFVDSNINAQIVRINTNNRLNKLYLFYFLRLNSIQNQIQNMQTGSALKQLPVNRLNQIEIYYPSTKIQSLIGETLLDIDKEILSIETKKEKYQAIKQGMMQELLTGKTRLV